MLVSVLASSSKGNSVYIKTTHHELLIDAGMNAKYLEEKLKENETSLKNIDYILITHTHSDHVSALNTITKKYNPTLIMTSLMFQDLPYLEKYDNIQILFDDNADVRKSWDNDKKKNRTSVDATKNIIDVLLGLLM